MSLDVLKLYCGEDVVRQNPKDIDPDRYTDDGELTELPEMPGREPERVILETGLEVHVPKCYADCFRYPGPGAVSGSGLVETDIWLEKTYFVICRLNNSLMLSF